MMKRQKLIAVIFSAAFGAVPLAGCGQPVGEPGNGGATAAGGLTASETAPVRVLAKVDGFRSDLNVEAAALVELAFDREAANRAWAENVPADLESREGEPADFGKYGEFEDIDFTEQVLLVWSSGQSSTCAEWLDDIRYDGKSISIQLALQGDQCLDDYNPYRLVVAVDADRLPAAADTAATNVKVAGGRSALLRLYE